jgi:hypothetical protein
MDFTVVEKVEDNGTLNKRGLEGTAVTKSPVHVNLLLGVNHGLEIKYMA